MRAVNTLRGRPDQCSVQVGLSGRDEAVLLLILLTSLITRNVKNMLNTGHFCQIDHHDYLETATLEQLASNKIISMSSEAC